MSFQKTVNINPPIGIPGSFASTAVDHSVIAGALQFVSSAVGTIISRFAWADTINGTTQNAKPADTTNWVNGFVGRDSNIAVITMWQDASSNVVPAGMEVTLYDRGDFFAVATTAATVGQKVFSSNINGALATGAAGATITDHTETNFTVAKAGAAGTVIKITAQ